MTSRRSTKAQSLTLQHSVLEVVTVLTPSQFDFISCDQFDQWWQQHTSDIIQWLWPRRTSESPASHGMLLIKLEDLTSYYYLPKRPHFCRCWVSCVYSDICQLYHQRSQISVNSPFVLTNVCRSSVYSTTKFEDWHFPCSSWDPIHILCALGTSTHRPLLQQCYFSAQQLLSTFAIFCVKKKRLAPPGVWARDFKKECFSLLNALFDWPYLLQMVTSE